MTADVAQSLLVWLRAELGDPELRYAKAPTLIVRGLDATVLAFELSDAPESHRGPLILRLFDPDLPAARVRRERVVHRILGELGYPVPGVLGQGRLGDRTFLLMERLPGRPFFDVLMPLCGVALLASALGWHAPWLAVGILYVGVTVRWMRRLHHLPTERVPDLLEGTGVTVDALRLDAAIDALEERARRLEGASLEPAIAWLREHRPEEGDEVLCHGDFWPGNLLCTAHGVSGLIDWGDALLAPCEYELAWSQVAYRSGLPVPGPAWLADPVTRLSTPLVWLVLSLNRTTYRALEPIDPARMRYFVAFHCVRILVFSAECRVGLTGTAGKPNPWTPTRVVAGIERCFERRTGTPIAIAR